MRSRRIAARHAAASPGSRASRHGAPRHARAGRATAPAALSHPTTEALPATTSVGPSSVSVTTAPLTKTAVTVIDLRDRDVRAAELVGAGVRAGFGGGPVRRPPAPRGATRLPDARPLGDLIDEAPLESLLDDDLAAVLRDDDLAAVLDEALRASRSTQPTHSVEDPAPASPLTRRAAPRHARPGRPPGVGSRRAAARHARAGLPGYRHAAARPAWPVLVFAALVTRLVGVRDRIRVALARSGEALSRPIRQLEVPRFGLASASRIGIVAALAVVTIVAPAAGVAAGPITPSGTASAGALDLPRAREALATANYRAIIPDPPSHVPVPGQAVTPEPTGLSGGQLSAISAQAQAVGAAQGHANLPGCTGVVVQQGAENGKLNVADLCELPFAPGKRLRADAALALARMNAEYFVAFGRDMCIGDAYRSFEEQQAVRARKPGLAAPAGMSNHGWALAVDMCDGAVTDTTPEYAWFAANAGKFGWANPEWALQGGRGPHEPWHWEYAAAVAAQRAQAGLAPISGN